jgi:hypothetical protein
MKTAEITFTVPVMVADDVAENLKIMVQSSVMRPEEPANWMRIEIIELAQNVFRSRSWPFSALPYVWALGRQGCRAGNARWRHFFFHWHNRPPRSSIIDAFS